MCLLLLQVILWTSIHRAGEASSPRPASREDSVAGDADRTGATEAGRLEGGVALALGLTTAGEPGPRSIRLSAVASLRTCGHTIISHRHAMLKSCVTSRWRKLLFHTDQRPVLPAFLLWDNFNYYAASTRSMF